jgi:cytochrome c
MNLGLFRCAAIVAFLFYGISLAWADGDVAHGQVVFGKCALCHNATAQAKIGPGLAGVVGRKAGSVPGFNYSPALVAFGKTWDEQTLDTFLSGPMKLVPGTRMPIALPSSQDRVDVIAYLKSLPAK